MRPRSLVSVLLTVAVTVLPGLFAPGLAEARSGSTALAARPAPAAKAGSAPPATTGPSALNATLHDRVVAVVDEDPILATDLDRIVGLGLAAPNTGESQRDFQRRLLGELIEQRLRFHEVDRFGFEQVPVDQIEAEVAKVRGRFKSDAELQQRLKELGLSMASLRQLVARQLMVLTYVDERLGPRVFVTADDIAAYYRDVLTPEMKKRNQPVPPLPEVREQIRTVLKEQRLNTEIQRWTEELRQKATVANYFDEPTGAPLPPVVKTIAKAPAKKKPA